METLTAAREATLRQREMMRKRRTPEAVDRVFSSAPGYMMSAQLNQNLYNTELAYTHNRGEPYAAVRPIAQRIAGQPWHVAEVVNPEGTGEKAWRPPKKGRRRLSLEEMAKLPKWMRNRIKLPTLDGVGECVKAIKSMHSAAVRVDILERHAAIELLNAPNPRMNGHTLIDNTVVSLYFTGKMFWWLTKGDGRPYDLWYIPAHRVVDPEHNVMLDQPFEVLPKNGTQSDAIDVPAKYMIYCYHPNPADPMQALAPIRACMQNVRVGESITTCQEQAFNNGLFPTLAVITGDIIDPSGKNLGKAQLQREQINEIMVRLNQQHRGPMKAGYPIVMDRVIDKIEPISMKPNEMDWMNSQECNTEAIWASVGTPPVVAGRIKDANRATALVAEESFVTNVLIPRTTMLSYVANDRLLPLYNSAKEDLIMWMEEPVSSDKDQQLKENTLLLGKRGMTIDELRTEMGKPPLPNGKGDVLISSATDIIEPLSDEDDESVAYREEFIEDQATAGKPPGGGNPPKGDKPKQTPPPSADETATGKGFLFEGVITTKPEDRNGDLGLIEGVDYFIDNSHKASVSGRMDAWLKMHGRQEKSFAKDLRKFLDAQVKHITSQIEQDKEPFNPREWDKGLIRLAKPHLMQGLMTGAKSALSQSANLRSHKDDVVVDFTDEMLKAIRDYLDELVRYKFWMDINDTTAERLASQLQESIASGETLQQRSKRVHNALGSQTPARALAIARTETTGALGAGQYLATQDMVERGIIENDAWFANDDAHTRPTHWAAHDQRRGEDGFFDVGGFKGRFPCDPELPPQERVNCRCSTYSVMGERSYEERPSEAVADQNCRWQRGARAS